jgi:hypothetical protein
VVAVLAMTLDTAKNLAIAAVGALVALSIAMFWIMKSATQKLLAVVILGLVALLAWSQRAAVTDCADRVRDAVEAGVDTDTTCTFFGLEVTVPDAPG